MNKENKDAVGGCFFFITLSFSISGLFAIVEGDYFYAFLLYMPLICCLLYFVFYRITIVPSNKRKEALRKMYKYPRRLVKEDGEQWGKVFLQLINAELDNISESQSKKDLQQCQHIVKKMTKDEVFKNLHRAFRLTGCHLMVTDNDGKPITKIV